LGAPNKGAEDPNKFPKVPKSGAFENNGAWKFIVDGNREAG